MELGSSELSQLPAAGHPRLPYRGVDRWLYRRIRQRHGARRSDRLDDAPADQREAIIRRTLTAILDNEGYLDCSVAEKAIAAAAVIGSQRPGGRRIRTPYGPDFPVNGGTLDLPAGLDGLAVRALDRILGDQSEWRSLWEESGHYPRARAELLAIRTVLARDDAREVTPDDARQVTPDDAGGP
jgi:hypothetical protein